MKKNKTKRVKFKGAARSPEVKYRNQLLRLTADLRRDVRKEIVPLLREFEPQYLKDSYSRVLEEAFDRLQNKYNNIGALANKISSEFVDDTNNKNKERFYRAMDQAVGVNLQSVIQNEGIEDDLRSATRTNVNLIKSIPAEYFKNIETVVFNGTMGGLKASSMISEIVKQGRTTTNRAKLIARDQSSKLNASLNQQRQENLGIEEYVWQTAEDNRVRETHVENNGKVFRWDQPPPETGHPGHDINCRCIAQPIIKI